MDALAARLFLSLDAGIDRVATTACAAGEASLMGRAGRVERGAPVRDAVIDS